MHTIIPASFTCLALVVSSTALAQGAPDAAAPVGIGDQVRIRVSEGDDAEGTVRAWRPDGVALETAHGLKIIPVERIQTVERRDTVRNGLLVGAGIGLAVGVVPLVYGNECRYETCAGSQIGLPLAGAVLGGLIGWSIDRAIGGWTTVYDRTSVQARVSFHARQGVVAARAVFSW